MLKRRRQPQPQRRSPHHRELDERDPPPGAIYYATGGISDISKSAVWRIECWSAVAPGLPAHMAVTQHQAGRNNELTRAIYAAERRSALKRLIKHFVLSWKPTHIVRIEASRGGQPFAVLLHAPVNFAAYPHERLRCEIDRTGRRYNGVDPDTLRCMRREMTICDDLFFDAELTRRALLTSGNLKVQYFWLGTLVRFYSFWVIPKEQRSFSRNGHA